MGSLEKAIGLAVTAHKGQKDKAGGPYILHPLRVMFRMDSVIGMIAAVLHDVVEDTKVTLEDLRHEGFSEEVVSTVACLTRKSDESYDAFIDRIKDKPMARKIKLADLEDNMDIRRVTEVGKKDLERLERYHRAWMALSSIKD